MTANLEETIAAMPEAKPEIPMLDTWKPDKDHIFMEPIGEYVQAHYEKIKLHKDNKLNLFVVKKKHHKDRMEDMCHIINYYLTYFDPEWNWMYSTMTVKYLIDKRPTMSKKGFRNTLLDMVVNDDFIQKIKKMANYLYHLNIDSDTEGKYKSNPKITNDQARLIVAITFAIRCVLPLCIHFSETNTNFLTKKDYIKCFDDIIMKIIRKFEKDDIQVFSAMKEFIGFRVERAWHQDIGVCSKKKQLYGISLESYMEEVIHEVILVKSLYKLDYNRSVVSFIDGIVFRYHQNFKIEKFKSKPIEIDPQENGDDDGDRISHVEAIEMSVYRIDESNSLINEVNTEQVLESIRKHYSAGTTPEELQFYKERIRVTPISQALFEAFYAKIFKDPNATTQIDPETTIELIVYMKKYFLYKGMVILPQLFTANMRGKYKENAIKNAKFLDKIKTSNIYQSVIQGKYTYVSNMDPKSDDILLKFSTFVSSQYEFIDYNGPDDGRIYDDVDQDTIIYEFSLFLSLI